MHVGEIVFLFPVSGLQEKRAANSRAREFWLPMTFVTFAPLNRTAYHEISMPLESLLLSRDPEVIRILQPALEKLSIDVEVCRGVGSGQEILRTEKFDAIIVDCDDLKGALRCWKACARAPATRIPSPSPS